VAMARLVNAPRVCRSPLSGRSRARDYARNIRGEELDQGARPAVVVALLAPEELEAVFFGGRDQEHTVAFTFFNRIFRATRTFFQFVCTPGVGTVSGTHLTKALAPRPKANKRV